MANKTLVIGIGSTGTAVVRDVMERIENEYGSLASAPWVRLLAFETEEISDHPLQGKGLIRRVTIDTVEENNFKDNQGSELDSGMKLSEWWDPNAAHRMSAGMPGAGNNRMIGKLLAMTERNLTDFLGDFGNAMSDLQRLDVNQANLKVGKLPDGSLPNVNFGSRIYVYLCGTLTGGTASGFFIDAGYLLRQYIRNDGYEGKVIGLFGLPNSSYKSGPRKASAYAALMELNHFYHHGSKYNQKFHHANFPRIEGRDGDHPFDEVFLGMPKLGDETEHPEEPLNDSFGEFIYVSAMSKIGNDVAAQLINPTTQHAVDTFGDGSPQQFGTFGVSVIEYPAAHIMRGCCSRLAIEALREWTKTSLQEEGTRSIVVTDLKITDEELANALTKDDAKTSFGIVEQILTRSVSDARKSKTDAAGALLRGEAEIGRLFQGSSDTGSPLLALIEDNLTREKARILDEIRTYFREAMADITRGPEYCVMVCKAAKTACADVAVEIEGWRQLKTAGQTTMKDAIDRIRDAQSSTLLGTLFWRAEAIKYWTNRYQGAAKGHWNAARHVACEEHKLEILKALHALVSGDPEGLLDIIDRRLTDEDRGIRQWTRKLVRDLEEKLADIDIRPPRVNGYVLYEPGKTLSQEYAKLIPLAQKSVVNEAFRKRFPQPGAFAQAVLIDSWKWIHDQPIRDRSAFDSKLSTGQNLPVKAVLVGEINGLLELGRPFFLDLFQRNVVQLMLEGEDDTLVTANVTEASNAAIPFLRINDAKSPLGRPGRHDTRTPSFAFYKGSTSQDPLALKLKKLLEQGTTITGPIVNFGELDLPYRVVLIRGRVVFPIRSIEGIDDLERWYQQHSNLVGLHTHAKLMLRPIKGDKSEVEPLVGEFLASVAIKLVTGGIPGDFQMNVPADGPNRNDRVLSFGHELVETAQNLLSPLNQNARSYLQRGIKAFVDGQGSGEFCQRMEDFCNSADSYKMTYKGDKVDKELCGDLLFKYLRHFPGVWEEWKALNYVGRQPNVEDYRKPRGTTPELLKQYPIDGYYCPKCNNLLANLDGQGADVPAQCAKCGSVLRLDVEA